jgi:acyl-coenzyme A thioesterase PaaI-like protein
VSGVVRGLLGGAALATALALAPACIVRRLAAPRVTGTCDGACAHYASCKPDPAVAAEARCRRECPEVFSDDESLRAYESLSCAKAVEYVDGPRAQAALR